MRLTAYLCIRPYITKPRYVIGSKRMRYKMCIFKAPRNFYRTLNRAGYMIKNVKNGRSGNGWRMKHTHTRR